MNIQNIIRHALTIKNSIDAICAEVGITNGQTVQTVETKTEEIIAVWNIQNFSDTYEGAAGSMAEMMTTIIGTIPSSVRKSPSYGSKITIQENGSTYVYKVDFTGCKGNGPHAGILNTMFGG